MDKPAAWQTLLDETLAALQSALGANLHSVVLYGSAARGDYVAGVSDLNLLIVLRESGPAAHAALAGVLRSRSSIEPFVLGLPGLARTARTFPAKFSAIRRTSRLLYGPDPLADVPHYPELERFAAEQALRNLRLRLVYNYLRQGHDPKAYTRFVLHFSPGVFAACNTALELEGRAIPRSRAAQAAQFAQEFGVDCSVLDELTLLKKQPQALDAAQVETIHARLFAIVMAALAWVEERWPV